MFLLIAAAHAATWTVSPAPSGASWDADAVIDGVCASALGACTLRAALEESARSAGSDTVLLPPGDFPVPGAVTVSAVQLIGAGMAQTRLVPTSGALFRVIGGTLGVSDLTVYGAAATTTDPAFYGGAGSNLFFGYSATITLERVGLDALRGIALVGENTWPFDAASGSLNFTLTDIHARRGSAPILSVEGGYYVQSPTVIQGLTVDDVSVTGDLLTAQHATIHASDVVVTGSTITGALVRVLDNVAVLSDVLLRGNVVGNLLGVAGGPSIDFGTLQYERLRATGNTSVGCGATTDAWSFVSLLDSVVASNTLGGAVICGAPHVSNSTIAANTITAGQGGAIRASGYLPWEGWVRDSLIARNRTPGSGGGISADTPWGDPLEITGVTLIDNVADADGDGLGEGGNLWVQLAAIESVVMVGGRAGGAPSDCVGTFTQALTSFVGVEPTPGACAMGGANIVGSPALPADAMLFGPVRLPNGRSGYVPLRGSPLIDAGTPRTGSDHAGQARALDGDGDGLLVPDIGAVERNVP